MSTKLVETICSIIGKIIQPAFDLSRDVLYVNFKTIATKANFKKFNGLVFSLQNDDQAETDL